MPRAARTGVRGSARVPGVPPAMAPRPASMVRALRTARTALRALPAVPRMARGVAARSIRRLAGWGSAGGDPRAEIQRPAAHRHGSGARPHPARSAPVGRGGARSHSARAGPSQAPGLQPERNIGASARSRLGAPGTGTTTCQNAGYADTNGVDTSGSSSERGGGFSSADCGFRIAEPPGTRRIRNRQSAIRNCLD